MPASNTRVAVAAVVVVMLALAGLLGWRHMVIASGPAVRLATSMPDGRQNAASARDDGRSDAARAASPKSEPGKSDIAKDAAVPSFDIVRVEPTGDALLAGRSKPNETVALVTSGQVVAETKADAGGNFVMTPPTLKPGDYALSLREGQGAATKDSKQSVVVSIPSSKFQSVVVAMAEPGKATAILSAPPETKSSMTSPTAPPVAAVSTVAPKLAIRSVELESGSGLLASGVAPPGTGVRLYLNDSRIADVIAAAAGRWTVTVRKGLSAGRYAVRADSLKADHSVDARVEVAFDVPATDGRRPAGSVGRRKRRLRPLPLKSPMPASTRLRSRRILRPTSWWTSSKRSSSRAAIISGGSAASGSATARAIRRSTPPTPRRSAIRSSYIRAKSL